MNTGLYKKPYEELTDIQSPYGFLLFFQEWFCYVIVEIVDQRAHKKSSDDRSDSGNCRNRMQAAACQQIKKTSGYDTNNVGGNTDKFKFSDLPVFGKDQCDSVIGGYAHCCGEIKCGAETHNYDCNQQK